MTNDEYLKELAQRGDGSLAAWFESEHVESANGTLETLSGTADAILELPATVDDSRVTQNDSDAQSSVTENSSDVFTDSREKLESEICERCYHVYDTLDMRMGDGHWNVDASRELVLEWLDRQAAITTAECERICDTCEWPERAAAEQERADVNSAGWSDAIDKWAESNASWERITQLDGIGKERIEKLLAQRDEARDALDDAMKDVLVYKERADDASAFADSCREELREAYGFMLDISDSLRAKAAAHER